jgi:hypothetical protein
MAYRLRLQLGAEDLEVWIPVESEAMRWTAAVLREAADRLGAAADALSRQEKAEAAQAAVFDSDADDAGGA